MSIVTDVRRDVAELKTDRAALRKFGLLVGGVFLLLGAWGFFLRHHAVSGSVFLGLGGALMLFGAVAPGALRAVYIGWMALAMSLGWCVSRVLLIALYFLVVTPLGLLARVVGKRFIDLPRRGERTTMWVPRPVRPARYDKMY